MSLALTRSCSISIHALHAECDNCPALCSCSCSHFNPRTPCGVRPELYSCISCLCDFNPRTPCGVRLKWTSKLAKTHQNFNPRTPCGVRPTATVRSTGGAQFQSTHSMRSATTARRFAKSKRGFQSTHSMRSATLWFSPCPYLFKHFNPRTPCGVRRAKTKADEHDPAAISIHALHAECD